jgi:hypothetical protein
LKYAVAVLGNKREIYYVKLETTGKYKASLLKHQILGWDTDCPHRLFMIFLNPSG